MAPMVGEHVEIMSQCHHCAAPIGFSATPQEPRHDADGVMVWFGKRADDRCKAIDGL